MKNKVVATIKLYGYLLVPIQVELDDETVDKLQEQILNEIQDHGIKGIVIDVSMVDIIDSYISYTLSETAKMARMMGCTTVIAGIRPEVALTLSQMGIKLTNIIKARNLEDALDILNSED